MSDTPTAPPFSSSETPASHVASAVDRLSRIAEVLEVSGGLALFALTSEDLIAIRRVLAALHAQPRASQVETRLTRCPDEIAVHVAQRVAELPNRTSPDDWPEAMIVTSAELQFIVTDVINDALAALHAQPAEPSQRAIEARLKSVVRGNTLVICPTCKSFGECSGDLKYTCDRCGFFPLTVKANAAVAQPAETQEGLSARAPVRSPASSADAGTETLPEKEK